MEENKSNTGQIALKYGLIIGAIGIAFNLMLYSQDLHYQVDFKRILITLAMGLIFVVAASIFAMIEFKKGNDGWMSLSEGLKIGVGLSLISGIIGISFGFVLSEVIDPDMTEKAIDFAIQSMRDADMTEEQINQRMEGSDDPNIPLQIGGYLIYSIFLGFIGSIVPALVIKKKEEVY